MHGIATKASILFKRTSLWVLLVTTTALLFSCKDDLLVKEITDNVGHSADLSFTPGYYDEALLDITEEQPAAKFTVRYRDREKGNLLEKIEFVASFQSHDGTIGYNERHLTTMQASDFSPMQGTDSLSALLSIPIDTIATTFGLNTEDIEAGDQLLLRWKMYLTTGDTLVWGEVSNGTCWCPPLRVKAVHGLSADEFTGRYRFEQQVDGPFGMPLFSESFEAELRVDPDQPLIGRLFKAVPYTEADTTLDSLSVPLSLNRIATIDGVVYTDYYCEEDSEVRWVTTYPTEVENYGFDPDDDSKFILHIYENSSLSCGKDSEIVSLTASKIE